MSGFQTAARPAPTFARGRPPTPVVPVERVRPKPPPVKAAAVIKGGFFGPYRPRRIFRRRPPEWLERIEREYDASGRGSLRKKRWVRLARLYAMFPYRPLQWFGKVLDMHHASILHALRTMAIYEERDTPEWREAYQRSLKRRGSRKTRTGEYASKREAERAKRAAERIAKGLAKSGGPQLLSADQVQQIRRAGAEGAPDKVVARAHGVAPRTVRDIVKGRAWRHLPPPEGLPRRDRRTRLTDEQVREIRRLRADGLLCDAIAVKFGISASNVSDIGTGRRRADVQ